MRSPFSPPAPPRDRESRVLPHSLRTSAARSAKPRRRIRQWRPGEAVPGDGAAPCQPASNLLAAEACVLFPIARAASRGLAQPGFNEVAPCVASSAARVARPHRNLSVILHHNSIVEWYFPESTSADRNGGRPCLHSIPAVRGSASHQAISGMSDKSLMQVPSLRRIAVDYDILQSAAVQL